MGARRTSYLSKHVLLTTAALCAVVLVGSLAGAPLVVHFSSYQPDLSSNPAKGIAEVFQASLGGRAPEQVVKEMAQSGARSAAGDIFIADEQGKILAMSYGAKADFQLQPRFLPAKVFQVGPLDGNFPSPRDPVAVRLEGGRFLVFRPSGGGGPEFMMLASMIVLGVFSLLLMALSSFALLRKLRGHATQVDSVMQRLRKGELSARLEIKSMDEFGEIMQQFNLMAEEVETLFQRLREKEKTRVHLLQEIGHDLRTPLSSLLNLLEILLDKFDKLPDSEKKEFLATGRLETRFIQRLVEDLLLLARVEDPACLKNDVPVCLSKLILEEVEAKKRTCSVEFRSDIPESLQVMADPLLLKRLFRNALDNSASFASSCVTVSAEPAGSCLELRFDDDGPGFTEEMLKSFGQKRPTRIAHESAEKRVTLGLGSVIMLAIARLYEGGIQPSNRVESNRIAGARIAIRLRLDNPPAAAIHAAEQPAA